MTTKNSNRNQEPQPRKLSPEKEAYLKASKEITVKFIETGRLSLGSFKDAFGQIYRTIRDTVEEDKIN